MMKMMAFECINEYVNVLLGRHNISIRAYRGPAYNRKFKPVVISYNFGIVECIIYRFRNK